MAHTMPMLFFMSHLQFELSGARHLPPDAPVDFVLSQPGRDWELVEVPPREAAVA